MIKIAERPEKTAGCPEKFGGFFWKVLNCTEDKSFIDLII